MRYAFLGYLKGYFVLDLITLIHPIFNYRFIELIELLRLRAVLRATNTIKLTVGTVRKLWVIYPFRFF